MNTVEPYGSRALLYTTSAPLAAATHCRRLLGHLAIDVVAAEDCVMITFHTGKDRDQAAALLVTQPQQSNNPTCRREIDIAVDYSGADLPTVATATGLTVDEVIAVHSRTVFQAAFAGFAPGFVYLTGLPATLQLPRRSTPRTSIPAGSVAIATHYSAVYPTSSPGGWHLIGVTSTRLFDVTRDHPAYIRPGDQVRFHAC